MKFKGPRRENGGVYEGEPYVRVGASQFSEISLSNFKPSNEEPSLCYIFEKKVSRNCWAKERISGALGEFGEV